MKKVNIEMITLVVLVAAAAAAVVVVVVERETAPMGTSFFSCLFVYCLFGLCGQEKGKGSRGRVVPDANCRCDGGGGGSCSGGGGGGGGGSGSSGGGGSGSSGGGGVVGLVKKVQNL